MMAALNFVAVEDGLEEDPKIGTLSRVLHVPIALAVWFVVRLRRMVLHHGDHISGTLPAKFREEDIASFLHFDGRAKALTDALKRQGYLVKKRGRGFSYPDWENTITGRYASQREQDRLWHERDRQKRRSDDVARRSDDVSPDGRATSADIQTGRKEGRESGGPPVPPPKGGQALGASRWGWLMEHAPTPQNREVCARYLGTMSEEDWALVQYAYTSQEKGGPNISRKNARTLAWPTDVFLRKTAFLRFAGYLRTFQSSPKEPASKPAAEPPDTPMDRARNAWLFLQEYLADPMWKDEEKEKRKAHYQEQWGCKPWDGERPWEKTKPTKGRKRS